MDQTGGLADDMIADILRRLPPCNLAAAHCVRKAWCAVVDAHGLLLSFVLPHKVCGLFVNYKDCPRFFARPSSLAPPVIDGNLDFLPHYSSGAKLIVDHCNGLLLYRDGEALCVVNPATRRWEHLPCEDYDCNAYLVFDPAVSLRLRYKVFSIPREPPSVPNKESTIVDTEQDLPMLHIKKKARLTLEQYEEAVDLPTSLASPPVQRRGENQDPHDATECPPSSWTLNVFSSSTRKWKKKTFVREAEAIGTMSSYLLRIVCTE
ncbi:hypothetical protein ACQ4PT_045170 [Festuca glaucescens]